MQTSTLAQISDSTFSDEQAVLRVLCSKAEFSSPETSAIETMATGLVSAIREKRGKAGSLDAFLQEYDLSSQEGVVLMCLAEALLRIPDAGTADKLIADKLTGRDWDKHFSRDNPLLVNASAWSLMLSGRILDVGQFSPGNLQSSLQRVLKRAGEPIIRNAMKQAMRIMAKQFVFGRTIEEAVKNSTAGKSEGYLFSFDMLGEGAMTMADADRYLSSYRQAIDVIASLPKGDSIFGSASLSVKLSALHPRYETKCSGRVMTELLDRALDLCRVARTANIGLTIDAEEQNRLELSLHLFEKLAKQRDLAGWDGLGLAVQAYGKRALPVLAWLRQVATSAGRRLPVRLVKGAYWDTEIKKAQEGGYSGYPVFTSKSATDTSYLACAKFLLAHPESFYPQFATHNAHTVSAISVVAQGRQDYEFQRLHGMGQDLYESLPEPGAKGIPCRVYAPVGSHEDLLSYLVRRLLENGANTSFVNRLADDELPISAIIADPVMQARQNLTRTTAIPLPASLFGDRQNSKGEALWLDARRSAIESQIAATRNSATAAASLVDGQLRNTTKQRELRAPHDRTIRLGTACDADAQAVSDALKGSMAAGIHWDSLGADARAEIMENAADLFEADTSKLIALLVIEAGKSMESGFAEVREAVDFLRYYARQARLHAMPLQLPGPTGESNELRLHGRGIFACISPWNFPLAIFTGQIAAALVCGNTVIAKPAEQTPLIALEAVRVLHRAGVPTDALQLLLGDGAEIAKLLLPSPLLAGVAFTGSNQTALAINRMLAGREGPIATLIAETGGINAMIIDSSALPEQAVRDLVSSAFDSAGQRCSATRVAFVQRDIFPRIEVMLRGMMEELTVGDPCNYSTDIGPVIDGEAAQALIRHKEKMFKAGRVIAECKLSPECRNGTFVAPAAYEISSMDILKSEVFGPILHVVQYDGDRLDVVCDTINRSGYGLTLGLHTRIETVVQYVRDRCRVGNMYVNRNQIGAIVGSQPFGGEGLSGTGPKAGGPHYLARFCVERVCSVDTTAAGGNAALLAGSST